MRLKQLFVASLVLFSFPLWGQGDKVYETFKDTRIVNSASIETLPKGKLDIRIGHRFGDIAGDAGGWPTFYGLENASDVMIGADYGLTNSIMVGINRAKGAGPLRQNINGSLKVKLLSQDVAGSAPVSLAFYGLASFSTMQKSETEGIISAFEKQAHRLAYHSELIVARKFSSRFSLQLSGGLTYRNIVEDADENVLVSVAGATRFQVNKSFAVLLEGRLPFSDLRTSNNGFYPPVGIGLEWETGGGHVFQVNFTNATGMAETDFIPYTMSEWADGEFRLGFTISRLFNL